MRLVFPLLCSVFLTAVTCLYLPLPALANEIKNGDAELEIAFCGAPLPVDHYWLSEDPEMPLPVTIDYSCGEGYPVYTDPGPPSRGDKFFAGGPGNPVSSAFFFILVDPNWVDAGGAEYALSGYLGGYYMDNDNVRVELEFKSGLFDETIDTVTLGPVLAADRHNATGLLFRSIRGPIPIGTRAIVYRMIFTREAGFSNDGYADGLSLVLDPSARFAFRSTPRNLLTNAAAAQFGTKYLFRTWGRVTKSEPDFITITDGAGNPDDTIVIAASGHPPVAIGATVFATGRLDFSTGKPVLHSKSGDLVIQ